MRAPSDLIFRKRLEYMASRVQGLNIHFVVEQHQSLEPRTGYRGQFNQFMLGLITPDYLEREVYRCGAEPFMRAVRKTQSSLGFDRAPIVRKPSSRRRSTPTTRRPMWLRTRRP